MNFSNSFISDVTWVYHSSNSTYLNAVLNSELTFDKNNIFKKNIIIDTSKEDIEIPVLLKASFENFMYKSFPENLPDKIILPLYVNGMPVTKKTFNSVIKDLFNRVTYSDRLSKVVLGSNEEVFYGGNGIILDKDFNPILLCTVKLKNTPIEVEGVSGYSRNYYRAVCRIHPKVFEDSSSLMYKGIIKKLIPLYSSTNTWINTPYNGRMSAQLEDTKVEVIISEFNQFFTTPIPPSPNEDMNTVLNNCLKENIEEILNLL